MWCDVTHIFHSNLPTGFRYFLCTSGKFYLMVVLVSFYASGHRFRFPDILTCHSRKSTCRTYNINYAAINYCNSLLHLRCRWRNVCCEKGLFNISIPRPAPPRHEGSLHSFGHIVGHNDRQLTNKQISLSLGHVNSRAKINKLQISVVWMGGKVAHEIYKPLNGAVLHVAYMYKSKYSIYKYITHE